MEGTAGKKSYINWILMAVNALVFLYLEVAGSSEDAYFMYTKGAMLKAAVMEDGEYYRLLTAMFMHFGIGHLVNNMIVLFALGDNLERALGHVKYLILYLFSGIGANWISMMIGNNDLMVVSAGASGAIFGGSGGLFSAVAVPRGRLGVLPSVQ